LVEFIAAPNSQREKPARSPVRWSRSVARIIERFQSSSLRVIVRRSKLLTFFFLDQSDDPLAFCLIGRAR